MPEAVIIVPWRDKGDRWRSSNLSMVLCHLDLIDIAPVDIVGDGRYGSAPFNRSAAYNLGVARNPTAQVFIFYEADMLIGRSALITAIELAAESSGLVVPFSEYHYLSQSDTERVRFGRSPSSCVPERIMADCRSNGAVNVLSASSLRSVGRWDESFEGWGFDDRAMAVAFQVATGAATRYVSGPGVHLWHQPGWSVQSRFRGGSHISPAEHAATVQNEHRFQAYRKARTPERVRALTAGGI